MQHMNSQLRNWRYFLGRLFLASVLCSFALAIGDDVQAANGSVVYTYDALGRVTTASYDTGVIVIYTYDANGNRTQQVINVNTSTLIWTATVTPCTANCWGSTVW
jgi:YD repeat-containing protein